jgi:uncharacterized protein (DUF2062 family)
MSRRNRALVAAFFAAAYIVSSVLRGQVVAGIVTAAIGAVLVYLVLTRVDEHNAAARRRRERAPE